MVCSLPDADSPTTKVAFPISISMASAYVYVGQARSNLRKQTPSPIREGREVRFHGHEQTSAKPRGDHADEQSTVYTDSVSKMGVVNRGVIRLQ